MSFVCHVALVGLVAALSGCFHFKMPPSVPAVDRPTLADDAVLEVESDRVRESRGYTERSDVCSRSGTDCVQVRTQRRKNVTVHVAAATLDGSPISISRVAAAASPEYVTDTNHLRELTSSCKRGRITMMGGGLGLTASYFLLQRGYATEPRDTMYVASGFAALAGGLAVMALGRFVAGGQHCEEAAGIYERWSTVYHDPHATNVRQSSAEMLELLVEKFNRDRDAARARSATTD